MTKLTSMKNIGREMAKKLTMVGIDSPEALHALGAERAFLMLKAEYPNVCPVHLYTLEGAVQDVELQFLSDEWKKELKAFSDRLKGK